MRRNSVVVVTTVSAAMLGAGWAAGVIDASTTASKAAPQRPATTQGGSDPAKTDTTQANSAASSGPAAAMPATGGVSGTFDGAVVATGEGPFQAEIVVTDNLITAVNVLVGGDSRRDSIDINTNALPTLQERVLSAQSWNVQGISGASYTVEGFLSSVKDAMTQAGLA